jgi:hypothetical protein
MHRLDNELWNLSRPLQMGYLERCRKLLELFSNETDEITRVPRFSYTASQKPPIWNPGCPNLPQPKLSKDWKQQMMDNKKLTLDQPAIYEIKVPGILDEKWLDWNGEMTVKVENERTGDPVTTLTITADQAGLQGLLRYLYSFGLPLISVICVDYA